MNNYCNSTKVRYLDPDLYDSVLGIPEKEGLKIGEALWQQIKYVFPNEEEYKILIPGVGTGRFLIPFLSAISEEDRLKVKVDAIEKDKNMYHRLEEKLKSSLLQYHDLVNILKVDFEKLEHARQEYHACFAFFIFHHLKDPFEGIWKMLSFLRRPDGLFFFSEEQGDKSLWDTNFQHINYEELKEIVNDDDARLSFAKAAYDFSRKMKKKGSMRHPLVSAGDNRATVDYLRALGLTDLWDDQNKKVFTFYNEDPPLERDAWIKAIQQDMFSFLTRKNDNEYDDEYGELIKKIEEDLTHSKIETKHRLRIYAFQAKKPSQAANETLAVSKSKRELLSRRIKQASVLRFAQRIIDDDIYKDEDLFQNELKNRLQVMENHDFFEKSVFVYLASWALHKGTNGKWRDKVPVWISKANDSDDSEPPWNFIATQFLYLLLSGKNVEISDFKIVDFVLHDMPDKCILAVEYFDNSPSRWDVNFDRFGKVEKITIPCSKRLVSLLMPFLKDTAGTVEYLKNRIYGDVRKTKKGWTISLEKFLKPKLLDGSPFNIEPILTKMKEVSNDAEFKRAIAEGKRFFEDISKFTGRESWKFSENQLTKLFIALLYTNLVGSFDEQRKWSYLYYIPGATHKEASRHDEKEFSSFCWMMLCGEELLEPEERHLRLTANLYGRADSTWSWAKRGEAKGIKILLGSMSHSTRHYASAISNIVYKDPDLAYISAIALAERGIWGELASASERHHVQSTIPVSAIIKGFLYAWVLQYARYFSRYEKRDVVLPPILCFQRLYNHKQTRYFVPGIILEHKTLHKKMVDSFHAEILIGRQDLSSIVHGAKAGTQKWASYFPDIFRQTIDGVRSTEGIEAFFEEVFLNAIKHSHVTNGEKPLVIEFLWDEEDSNVIFQIKNPFAKALPVNPKRSGSIGLKYISEAIGWSYKDSLDKIDMQEKDKFVARIEIPRGEKS
jgi:hypothetical protein